MSHRTASKPAGTVRHVVAGIATICAASVLTLAAGVELGGWAQTAEVQIEQIQGSVYLVSGAGVNITLSAGSDGLIMVDTGAAEMSAKVIAAIARMPLFLDSAGAPLPGGAPTRSLRYVINTSALPEHVGGNGNLAGAGSMVSVYAHENVLARLTQEKVPFRALPSLTFFGNRMPLSRWVNGEPVEILHLPAAVTDGDSVVLFHRSAVLSTGALFDNTRYPRIDLARGGSIEGLIVALNRMLQMVIPNANAEGGTYVVGARGRVGDIADLANYRNMVTIVRDRVAALIKKNMTLAQIQAARPSEDYDARWGREPEWTPDMFVGAIYTSLKDGLKSQRDRK